jgi:chorismate mutase
LGFQAVRGATQVDVDEREHVLEATRELVSAVLKANELDDDHVISMLFSATPDIRSVAPAFAARQLGLTEAALLCVQEMVVDGSMPRVIRLLAHVDTELSRKEITNVYLHGTDTLRREPEVPS